MDEQPRLVAEERAEHTMAQLAQSALVVQGDGAGIYHERFVSS
jgi:hypothetical protein